MAVHGWRGGVRGLVAGPELPVHSAQELPTLSSCRVCQLQANACTSRPPHTHLSSQCCSAHVWSSLQDKRIGRQAGRQTVLVS